MRTTCAPVPASLAATIAPAAPAPTTTKSARAPPPTQPSGHPCIDADQPAGADVDQQGIEVERGDLVVGGEPERGADQDRGHLLNGGRRALGQEGTDPGRADHGLSLRLIQVTGPRDGHILQVLDRAATTAKGHRRAEGCVPHRAHDRLDVATCARFDDYTIAGELFRLLLQP